jgi:phosphohistidine phosphatase SixA
MPEPIQKEYARLRRRPFLMPLGVPVALGLVMLAVLAWAVLSASTTTIYVIRHAEPAGETGSAAALSLAGELRAKRLVEVFGHAPAGLGLDAILVSEERRTQDTARPLANTLGLPVVVVPMQEPARVARAVQEFRGGRLLVIADRADLAPIVEALSGKSVPEVAATDFGTLFVVTRPRYSPASVGVLALP